MFGGNSGEVVLETVEEVALGCPLRGFDLADELEGLVDLISSLGELISTAL